MSRHERATRYMTRYRVLQQLLLLTSQAPPEAVQSCRRGTYTVQSKAVQTRCASRVLLLGSRVPPRRPAIQSIIQYTEVTACAMARPHGIIIIIAIIPLRELYLSERQVQPPRRKLEPLWPLMAMDLRHAMEEHTRRATKDEHVATVEAYGLDFGARP